MSQLLSMLMNKFMSGQLQNLPQMQMFNQMMSGKTQAQQIETLLNMARSKGIDMNAKMFSEADIKQLGLKL